MLYFDILPALDTLPKEAVGELVLAALHYVHDGIDPNFEDTSLKFAWAFLRPSVDRDGAAYDEKRIKGEWLAYCKRCKKGGTEPLDFDTWCQRTDNAEQRVDNEAQRTDNAPLDSEPTTTTTPSTTTTTTPSPNKEGVGAGKPPSPAGRRFIPPTLEEVTKYVRSRGSPVDPQGFIDFYASKGWLVGKTPMKDWKAACRNAESWERWNKPMPKGRQPQDFQPSIERIRKNNEMLDKFLEEHGIEPFGGKQT